MLKLTRKYYDTLRHLKWVQIKYRLIYKLKSADKLVTVSKDMIAKKNRLSLQASITGNRSWLSDNTFEFLNIKHQFKDSIDWNYRAYGKLWTYNLTYFDFLEQEHISKKEGLVFMHDFIHQLPLVKDGMEPFPISLRCNNWIKFLIRHQIDDHKIDTSLYQQLVVLNKKTEYHLLGNHLLENGFSLLFGACYFNDPALLTTAKKIITTQLNEQILPDGAHFELSPMYHQIMLFRVLDTINLLSNNKQISEEKLTALLIEKASTMLGWLQQMAFKNGELPQVNDSVKGIAPAHSQLLNYAQQLNIQPKLTPLKECGYRMIRKTNYETLVDVGQIGPDYIPGHAHSDTLNFILHHQGQPLIVDTAISTYEKNKQRTQERSTAAHNTVRIGEVEQSEVWGGFRVARRAKVIDLSETPNRISAAHDGYQKINCKHLRTFVFHENSMEIEDKVTGNKEAKAFLHFHPNMPPTLDGALISGSFGTIHFVGQKQIHIEPYTLAIGFNKTLEALKAVIVFRDELMTKIILDKNFISN